MSLPQITNPEPTTTPAQEEKQYADAYVESIRITCPHGGKWRAAVQYVAYDYATDEVAPGANDPMQVHTLLIKDLRAAAETDETIATAIGALLTAIQEQLAS